MIEQGLRAQVAPSSDWTSRSMVWNGVGCGILLMMIWSIEGPVIQGPAPSGASARCPLQTPPRAALVRPLRAVHARAAGSAG